MRARLGRRRPVGTSVRCYWLDSHADVYYLPRYSTRVLLCVCTLKHVLKHTMHTTYYYTTNTLLVLLHVHVVLHVVLHVVQLYPDLEYRDTYWELVIQNNKTSLIAAWGHLCSNLVPVQKLCDLYNSCTHITAYHTTFGRSSRRIWPIWGQSEG